MTIRRTLTMFNADHITIGGSKLVSFEPLRHDNAVLAVTLAGAGTFFIAADALPPNPGLAPHHYEFFFDEGLKHQMTALLEVCLFEMRKIDY